MRGSGCRRGTCEEAGVDLDVGLVGDAWDVGLARHLVALFDRACLTCNLPTIRLFDTAVR